MKRLAEKKALVTGGGQGLGEAIALRLAREGAAVCVADIREEGAARVAEAVRAEGVDAIGVRANVTDEGDVARMVAGAVERFGRLDLLVANAGILQAFDITEFPLDAWQRVLDVNLSGYFLCAREA